MASMSEAVARAPEPTATAQTAQTKRTLLAYGGIALPLSLAEIPIINYLPAFYAQELQLSAGLVGLVFLCARLWDGLSDVVVGWLSDRSKSHWGRRKPWVIAGAPFLMASTWFLCNPPPGAGLVYLGVWAALFYATFTAVKIPHLSWGTELATGYVERSRVSSFRETFTMLGNLFLVSAPLIFLSHDAPLRDVLFLISITVLLMVPLTVVPLGWWVHDPMQSRASQTRLFKELSALARDSILIRFLFGRLFFAVEEGVTNSLLVFSIGVGLQLPNKFFWIIFILYIATLCTLPLTMRLVRHVEKHRLLAAGIALYAVALGGLLVIPSGNAAMVITLWIAVGIANTTILVLPPSILADIIDNGEVKTGERRSGAYVAIDNLVYKLGMALGVGLSFGLLELVNYDPSAASHSPIDVRNIRLLGFGLPCVLLVPAIVFYLSHPITKKVHARLRAKISSVESVNSANQRIAVADKIL
jgi:glycoside/pentoside/hexuronide:cation symporter, GPH family